MRKKSNYQNLKTSMIICSGTELTQGLIQDTHVVFLGQELKKHDIIVKRIVFIPDEYQFFTAELEKAVEEADYIIITGGLGPTSDDLTRNVVAEVAHVPLVYLKDVWELIKKRSYRTGSDKNKLPQSNKKQAYIPEGFSVIKNHFGTACGFMGKIGNAEVIALPGPAFELQPMFLREVAPLFTDFSFDNKRNEIVCSVYMVSESYLEDCIQDIDMADVSIQTHFVKDRVVLTLYGNSKKSLENVFSRLVKSLGRYRIRKGNISLAESVLDNLIKKKKILVCAESCTGGLLGSWLTDVPGSSRAFWGSFVTYSNEAKTILLGVDPALIREKGAVSEEVVSAMGTGALLKSGCDICIAVSGIAGPDGGSKEKPVGTVCIALCVKHGIKKTKSFHFTGDREVVRRKTAVVCFFFIESVLLGDNILDIPVTW